MIQWNADSDGIVTLTLDDPDQRANTMNATYKASMAQTIDRLEAEKDSITGVIVTSAKDTFFAGGDLNLLVNVDEDGAEEFFKDLSHQGQYAVWRRSVDQSSPLSMARARRRSRDALATRHRCWRQCGLLVSPR